MKPSKHGKVTKVVLATFGSLILFLPLSANSQSLEQAVAYALDTNPEIHAAFTRFKVSEKQVEQAEAGYFPTLDATGGIGSEYTDSPTTRRATTSGENTEELTRRELGLSFKQSYSVVLVPLAKLNGLATQQVLNNGDCTQQRKI